MDKYNKIPTITKYTILLYISNIVYFIFSILINKFYLIIILKINYINYILFLIAFLLTFICLEENKNIGYNYWKILQILNIIILFSHNILYINILILTLILYYKLN